MKKITFITITIFLLAAGCNSSSTDSISSNNSAQNINNTAPVTSANQYNPSAPSFIVTTIQSMMQSGEAHLPPLVEIKTSILKKITFSNKKATPPSQEYLLEVGDKKEVAIMDISKFPQLYSQFTVGESVIARGAFGSFTCDANSMTGDAGITYLCKTLNSTQIFLPWIVAMTPIPLLGNKEPLEKITP